MPIWDKVKQELDRAGRVAQDALDEGRIRLEAFRARQHADRAAQALGYAVYRARATGADLDADAYERLSAALARHEDDASRLEAQLDDIQSRREGGSDEPPKKPDQADPPDATPPAAEPSADTISPTDTGTP